MLHNLQSLASCIGIDDKRAPTVVNDAISILIRDISQFLIAEHETIKNCTVDDAEHNALNVFVWICWKIRNYFYVPDSWGEFYYELYRLVKWDNT